MAGLEVMIDIRPLRLFSRFLILRENGRELTRVDPSRIDARAPLAIEGIHYKLADASEDGGPSIATVKGDVIASAEKKCLWSPTFLVSTEGRVFAMKADRFFVGNFEISESEKVVGFVRRRRSLLRRITAQVPTDLSAPARVFFPWLVLFLWDKAEYKGA